MTAPVILTTTNGRHLEAVATTEHAMASHGQAVVLLEGEPVGPGDLLPIREAGELVGVEAVAFVTVPHAAEETLEALEAAGYPVRRAPKPPGELGPDDDRADLAAGDVP